MKEQNGKKSSLILAISVAVVLAAGIGAGALYSVTDTGFKNEKAVDQKEKISSEVDRQDASSSPVTNPVEDDGSDSEQVDSVKVDSKPEYPRYIQDVGGCWAADNGPIGGIRAIYKTGDAYYIDVDLVEFYCGQQAIDEAKKDGVDEVNNGYWIRNKNPRIYTFRIDADPVVVLNYNDAGHNLNVSFDTWLAKFNGPDDALDMMERSIKLNPYWLTFNENRVNRLVMQFLP